MLCGDDVKKKIRKLVKDYDSVEYLLTEANKTNPYRGHGAIKARTLTKIDAGSAYDNTCF